MKKLLIGLVALTSISAFADCNIMFLRVAENQEINADILNSLESKGYQINPTYISKYGSYMEDRSLETGYDIFIGEQMQETAQRQRRGDQPIIEFFKEVGEGVASVFTNTRTQSAIVRKIKHVGGSPTTYHVSNWAGKSKNKLTKLSRPTKNEKVISWGLKNLPSCEEAKSLNL